VPQSDCAFDSEIRVDGIRPVHRQTQRRGIGCDLQETIECVRRIDILWKASLLAKERLEVEPAIARSSALAAFSVSLAHDEKGGRAKRDSWHAGANLLQAE